MVRFADLIGDGPTEPSRPDSHAPQDQPPKSPSSNTKFSTPQAPASHTPSVDNSQKERPASEAVFYEHILGTVVTLFSAVRKGQPVNLTEASVQIEQLPQIVRPGQPETVLAFMRRPDLDTYLYTHAVNVAILTGFITQDLGYSPAAVKQLALAGLVMDVGMTGELELLASEPRTLSDLERRRLHDHPQASLKWIENADGLSSDTRAAILAHHERLDGSGYPRGLQADAIPEQARILAIADTYDAMCHSRAYRRRYTPAQALKALIEGADKLFDRRFVKILVDEFTLYPPGSAVRLNTNEVGVVQRVHRQAPLRPMVLISRDASQHTLPSPRAVNLLEHPFIYVKEVVADSE